jgi:uncharacterized membrane protein
MAIGLASWYGLWHALAYDMRVLQLAHVALIVIVAGLYAWLMATLPPDDVWRTRSSNVVAVVLAIWAALLFLELLRTGDRQGLKERSLNAYRRLLNRAPLLIGSRSGCKRISK